MFELNTVVTDIDENGEEITEEVINYTDESGAVWTVPQDPSNTHYQMYLESLDS